MMTNLFSIFDPCVGTGSFSLNWLSALAGVFILPMAFWYSPSRYHLAVKSVSLALLSEMALLLGTKKVSAVLLLIPLFGLILMNNSLGLLPFVFTASSHLSFTLSYALPLWLGYTLYGWINNTKHMLAHLVPQGTPAALMSFMVLIETISNSIRPATLAVRLAANMIAGHLLLALLGGAISILALKSLILIVFSQMALLVLEAAVAAIQAYVFSVLSTLYAGEV